VHANNKNRFLDGVLDKALEEFGNGEPRTGLENRVLANLRTEQERTATKSGWWWAVASAVAATAVIGALWLGNHPGIPKDLVKMSRDSKKPEGLGALKVEQVARPQVPAPTSDAKMGRERRRLTSRTGTATPTQVEAIPFRTSLVRPGETAAGLYDYGTGL
jgi:hypothetical protein